EVNTFNASLLWEPWEVLKKDKTPYKVFTPYYRKGCLNAKPPQTPLKAPSTDTLKKPSKDTGKISDLNLLPKIQWHKDIEDTWEISEQGAKERLETFLDQEIHGYKEGRNFPSKANVSRLSPYLQSGEISPRTIWHAIQERLAVNDIPEKDADNFMSELGWREFSYNILYHFPKLLEQPLQERFKTFPWQENTQHLKAWQTGNTGYPIVDAGMRELWKTGYMHNRVRMIVGSFLVKHLLLHWHHGEKWFWDCLVDADLANNSASWQWIAGCGADAAPYFRIFNPITQGEKFDPDGEYIRKYVPELSALPDKYLNKPWEAPPLVLEGANIKLGMTYPKPIIDHSFARQRALDAFQSTKT
ncbi:MAG: cryptochrome/photolyase family protein, partial [Bdellovibrionales bacterium]